MKMFVLLLLLEAFCVFGLATGGWFTNNEMFICISWLGTMSSFGMMCCL